MEQPERTDAWLEERLALLWSHHFADVARANPVTILFSRNARARLGSIRQRAGITTIFITGHFRNPHIPEAVLDETIAHELVHYAHGFESPLPKLYRYPHEGGIVRRELVARGLGDVRRFARHWLKTHWQSIIGPPRRLRRRHLRRTRIQPVLLFLHVFKQKN